MLNSIAGITNIVVFYHAPCVDGAASAWCAYQRYKDKANYIELDHRNEYQTLKTYIDENLSSDISENTLCIFLDIAPSREILRSLTDIVKQVIIYDHHITTQHDLENFERDNCTIVFDICKSGAGLSWDIFFPDKKRPTFIDWIEKIDLGIANYRGDFDLFFLISSFLDTRDLSDMSNICNAFDSITDLSEDELKELGHKPRHIYREKAESILSHVKHIYMKYPKNIEHIPIVMANGDLKTLGREFFQRLIKESQAEKPIAMLWFQDSEDIIRINIRTMGLTCANKIAKDIANKYGVNGGGHDHSAVVRFKNSQFETFLKENIQTSDS